MRFSQPSVSRQFGVFPVAVVLLAAAVALLSPAPLAAQFFQNQAVGGISISSNGLIDNASVDNLGKLKAERERLVKNAPADLHAAAALRKVSLRGLEEAIAQSLKAGKDLPNEVLFLAGLQDIRYVFVYPEQRDIVLAGFGEGWRVDAGGNVVGVTTGKPVLLLDDLLVALRTAESSARTGISCSIDPTAEGIQQYTAYSATLTSVNNEAQRKVIADGMEKALGRQQVTFNGVPATSHFASVLLAADFRMKRVAMGFETSHVNGLSSFLAMYRPTGVGMDNSMQRWWLEPKYESVLRSPDGLAWELNGASAKCMTEEDYATATGQREHKGKANPVAQKWADNMTAHYDELAVAMPVFGELRNCMQLALVGALISHEHMVDRAGCALPSLMQDSIVKTVSLPTATQVDSRVSMLQRGSRWIISASGGVNITPADIASKAGESAAPAEARAKARSAGNAKWYWN